jgi:tyrosine-protein kinase Etk/Wzc
VGELPILRLIIEIQKTLSPEITYRNKRHNILVYPPNYPSAYPMSPEKTLIAGIQLQNSDRAKPFTRNSSGFLRYLLIYSGCITIALSAAYVYLRYKKPTYTVSTSLLHNASNAAVSDDTRKIELRSAVLQAVKSLNLTVDYKKKGRLVDEDLYKNVPVRFQLVRIGTPGSDKFEVTIKNKGTYLLKNGKVEAGEFSFNKIYTTEIGSWLIAKMPSFNKNIGRTIIIHVQDPETATETLQRNINLMPGLTGSNTVVLSTKDKVLGRAEDILAEVFKQLSFDKDQELNDESATNIKLIDERLLALNNEVDTLQAALTALNTVERNVNLSSASTNYLITAKSNGAALNEINFNLDIINNLEQYLRFKDITIDPPPPATALSDPTLNDLVRQVIANQSQQQQMLETHLKSDAAFKPLRQQSTALKKSMQQRIVNLKSSLLKRRKDLESVNKQTESRLGDLPLLEKKLVSIKHKQALSENLYASLLQRREEASLNLASNIGSKKIFERTYKLNVDKKATYAWALLFGILLPSCFVVAHCIYLHKTNLK